MVTSKYSMCGTARSSSQEFR